MTDRHICPPDHRHGVNNTCYNGHGCRCDDCRAFKTAVANQRYRDLAYGRHVAFLVPITGTRRRLQALHAIGWSQAKLAVLLGRQVRSIQQWVHTPDMQVERGTHNRVLALYEQLWNQTPPRASQFDRQPYSRSLNYAAAHGWLPPAAWDDIDTDPEPPVAVPDPDYIDHAAVELACSGQRVRLTPAERVAAIVLLNGQTLSDREISVILHMHRDSVCRIRIEHHIPAALNAGRERLYDQQGADAA